MSETKRQVTLHAVAWDGRKPVVVAVEGTFNGHTIRDLLYPDTFTSGAFGNRTVIAKTDMPSLGYAFTRKLAIQRAYDREQRLAVLSQERMEAATMAAFKLDQILRAEA